MDIACSSMNSTRGRCGVDDIFGIAGRCHVIRNGTDQEAMLFATCREGSHGVFSGELHAAMDRAVLGIYGWTGLKLRGERGFSRGRPSIQGWLLPKMRERTSQPLAAAKSLGVIKAILLKYLTLTIS